MKKTPTLEQLRSEIDARRIFTQLIMDAFKRNDLDAAAAAQMAMREKFRS